MPASGIDAALEWPYAELAPAGFHVPTNRGGCNVFGTGGGQNRGGERFDMNLDFAEPAYRAFCRVGEYRQYARGTIVINGVNIRFPLADSAGGPPHDLLPRPPAGSATDNFQEDGATRPDFWYGHRLHAGGATDVYQAPDRLTGCQFRGWDYPGYTGVPGETFGFDIDFRGNAVDRANGDEVLQGNQWLFLCAGTL